jgi:hypothetical protein
MPELSKDQQKIALIGGGAVVLYLVYRWWSNNQSPASTAAGQTAPNTSGADYASLAGQEQSDVAGLQNQEQSDVSALQAQEGSDVSGLTAGLQGVTDTLTGVGTQLGGVASTLAGVSTTQQQQGQQIASIASGQQAIDRTIHATIQTHAGGPFYSYYKTVTGKAPPATIAASNFVYQAWKNGVKATALNPKLTHPSAPKQTQIQHPNANHTPQQVAGKNKKPLPVPKPTPKPSPPKPSGVRK